MAESEPASSAPILSPHLALPTLDSDFLSTSLRQEAARARALHGWQIPDEWFAETALMQMRLEDCASDPLFVPWSLRAMVLRSSSAMVGCIGFHSRPGAAYLQELAPTAVELGYRVFGPHRRRGYATEAIRALMGWALADHAVDCFAISIAPSNEISQRLARKIGFQRVGSRKDPVDGWEDVCVLQGDALQRFVRAV